MALHMYEIRSEIANCLAFVQLERSTVATIILFVHALFYLEYRPTISKILKKSVMPFFKKRKNVVSFNTFFGITELFIFGAKFQHRSPNEIMKYIQRTVLKTKFNDNIPAGTNGHAGLFIQHNVLFFFYAILVQGILCGLIYRATLNH